MTDIFTPSWFKCIVCNATCDNSVRRNREDGIWAKFNHPDVCQVCDDSFCDVCDSLFPSPAKGFLDVQCYECGNGVTVTRAVAENIMNLNQRSKKEEDA